MTEAEFDRLTDDQTVCLLRRRFRLFLDAGAEFSCALILAAQIEVDEEAAIQLLRQGLGVDLTLRLLY